MKKSYISFPGMICLLAVQLLWSTHSLATDYYVDASLGDKNNNGMAPNTAFADFRDAMRQLNPGDTLYVRSGIYNNSDSSSIDPDHNLSGIASQPIIIKAYQNEVPIIFGMTIAIRNMEWWIFDGLIFENSATLAIGNYDKNLPTTERCTSTSNNIVVRNSHFINGSAVGIRISCGNNIRIENNVFDNIRSRSTGNDKNALILQYSAKDIVISDNDFSDIGSDAIHFLDNPGAQFINVNIIGNEFKITRPYIYRDGEGNTVPESSQPFDNVGENAIDIKQGPGPFLISNNIIHGYRPTTSGQDASGGGGEAINIHRNATNIRVSNNYIYNNTMHINAGEGTGNMDANLDVTLNIHNNIFGNAVTSDGFTAKGLFLHRVNNIKIHNNSFDNKEGDVLHLSDIYNTEIKNNLFQNGNVVISPIELTANYNAWSGITWHTSTGDAYPALDGNNDITIYNSVIEPDTWAPIDNSPLIDAGVSVGLTEDFYGSSINGLIPDIGAVEYQQPDQVNEPDLQPPVVYIASPLSGDTISGNIQVNVSATDKIGVNRVKLYIDDILLATDHTAPYTFIWDSSNHTSNTATIKAKAIDDAGNSTLASQAITINRPIDTQAPTVSFNEPLGGTASGNTQISISASDDISVTQVKLSINGIFVGNDTTAPYAFTWDSSNHVNGNTAKLRANAYDDAGNIGSDVVFVTVNNIVGDDLPPSVRILSPTADSSVSDNVSINIAAEDNVAVTLLKCYVDGSLKATSSSGTLSCSWNTRKATIGTHIIKAIAEDAAGNSTTTTIDVNVVKSSRGKASKK